MNRTSPPAVRLTAWVASLCVLATPALAHEPLFGETPVIFGPAVFHPEVKIAYFDAGSARRPGGDRMRMLESMLMLDYGVSRYLNLRLEAPYHSTRMERNRGGTIARAGVAGIGDVTARAKVRFRLRQRTGFQLQHSALVGFKLPTGESGHRFSDGERVEPREQTGSGKWGVVLGYAFDRETIEDTFWSSLIWRHDLGSGFRRGEHLELDIAYGRWLKLANTAEELGIILPVGLHGEIVGSDRLEGSAGAHNSYRLLGLQLTLIATRGRNQYRIGAFIPFARQGDAMRTDYAYQLRAAVETFY